jgi:methyl-accepting chemotaxis protein
MAYDYSQEPAEPGAKDLPPAVGNENLKPPPGAENDGRVVGTPTIPASARGIVDKTSRGNNNKKLAHVCNFIDEMRKNIYLKKFIKATAQAIREGIRKILSALGFTDKTGLFAAAAAKLKEAARWLKTVQKYLKDVIDFERYVLAFITKIRALIAWIRSLPARFMALLAQCLAKFLKLVGSVFTDFFKELTAGEDTGFGDLLKETKNLLNETVKTVKLAATAVAGAGAIAASASTLLTVPASSADLKAANKTIAQYKATLPSTQDVTDAAKVTPVSKSTP